MPLHLVVLLAPLSVSSIDHLTSALCDACEHVWFDAKWQHQVGREPEASSPSLNACFTQINASCWDCTHGSSATAEEICTHGFWHLQPQPISGHFSFCSGHGAVSVEDMSYTAWMRLISWRSQKCSGAFRETAWAQLGESRARPDAQWLPYYKAGTSGWQSVEDKESLGGDSCWDITDY